jgi:murein DD-endopeptidase MepM/ murein hydrolase activator NlpD
MKRLLLLIVLLVTIVPVVLWLLSAHTDLRIEPVKAIGIETPVTLHASNPHGIRRVTASIEQDGQRHTVFESASPANRFFFLRKKDPPQALTIPVGKKRAPALHDGRARLVVEAQSNDLRGAITTASVDVQVNTRPPAVTADGAQHYINQGGSELVTLNLGGSWDEAGVRVGNRTFRSFPMPGKDASSGERFALFAFSWDTPDTTAPFVYARDSAGNEATARFWFKVFPKHFRKRDLEITDVFLQKVVNELDPAGSGDLLARFLKINGEMRRLNNQTLADLRLKTEPRVLWNGPFLQLTNSQVESQFADVRTYLYQGKKVDQQTHLGFDLSVTRNVGVLAANDGKVIHAAPLGIYGNCIVIDHGYGLQSIYGHLSHLGVKEGDIVKQRQVIGKSGETGLAGGDHLHFSMQVDGVQVNPVEWWDAHWIQDRVWSKVPIGK